MLMKNLVVFMDCHGMEITTYLTYNKRFVNDFNIKQVSLNEYVVPGACWFNNKELANEHIRIIKNADVLILQVIEKDRDFLNNSEVIKYCKSDCKIIKIPHYRNSIYEYRCIENIKNKYHLLNNWNLPNKIKNINNIDETKKIIQNEIDIMNNFPYDKDDMLKQMNFNVDEFKQCDNLSDIKMLDYYKNNYKKYRLFMGRCYPSSRFFFELTNKLLITLNYNPTNKFIDTYFAENTSEPIPDYWYNFCNFSFENKYCVSKNILITECEWYYILLLSGNVNTYSEENQKYLSIIRQTGPN
jgi:hypothetical protein